MEVKASLKNLRISPRKVRLLANLVRGLEVNKAIAQLQFSNKQAKKPLIKLLNSAIANAENNFDLDKNNLKVSKIFVDESFTLKRWLPRAHGRATVLRKRASHVNLVLSEIKDSGVKEAKKQKLDKPVSIDEIGQSPKKSKTDKADKEIKKNENVKNESKDKQIEKGKEIHDPSRLASRGGHDKVEGASVKGAAKKMFRRKSG